MEISYLYFSKKKDCNKMILNKMKYNGAIYDLAYEQYLQKGGQDYLLSSQWMRWMPGKNSSRNVPEFLCKQSGIKNKNFCDMSTFV